MAHVPKETSSSCLTCELISTHRVPVAGGLGVSQHRIRRSPPRSDHTDGTQRASRARRTGWGCRGLFRRGPLSGSSLAAQMRTWPGISLLPGYLHPGHPPTYPLAGLCPAPLQGAAGDLLVLLSRPSFLVSLASLGAMATGRSSLAYYRDWRGLRTWRVPLSVGPAPGGPRPTTGWRSRCTTLPGETGQGQDAASAPARRRDRVPEA